MVLSINKREHKYLVYNETNGFGLNDRSNNNQNSKEQ